MIELSLAWSIVAFLGGAAVIALAGTMLTRRADELADRTGLGEAFMGAVFLGAITSLPGITASVTAAVAGDASLALSNAIGGIAAQTAFLAIADFWHRESNLEHAAASAQSLIHSTLLIVLLGLLLVAAAGPEMTIGWVHPASPTLLAVYAYGTWMAWGSKDRPMWRPQLTEQTQVEADDADVDSGRSLLRVWGVFGVLALVVAASGWFVTHAVQDLSRHTGINSSVAGAAFIAVATSLPELITSIAAVRQGALKLAVGGIIGGNAFDTLFAAVADMAYRDGSLYHAATSRELVLIGMSVVMTAVLLMGLVRRQKFGIAGIGFESFTLLLLYGLTMALLAWPQ